MVTVAAAAATAATGKGSDGTEQAARLAVYSSE
jgi:hypothetical protein